MIAKALNAVKHYERIQLPEPRRSREDVPRVEIDRPKVGRGRSPAGSAYRPPTANSGRGCRQASGATVEPKRPPRAALCDAFDRQRTSASVRLFREFIWHGRAQQTLRYHYRGTPRWRMAV